MTSCGCFEVIVAMTADIQAVIVGQPGVPRHDPDRHEVLHPGRLHRRRQADPRVHRGGQEVPYSARSSSPRMAGSCA